MVFVAQVRLVDGLAAGLQRAEHPFDDGKLLVVDLDQLSRGLGGRLVDSGHRRDRLALEAHLLQRDDGPVLLVRAVMRLHVDKLRARQHGVHAADRSGFARVDAGDARVG